MKKSTENKKRFLKESYNFKLAATAKECGPI